MIHVRLSKWIIAFISLMTVSLSFAANNPRFIFTLKAERAIVTRYSGDLPGNVNVIILMNMQPRTMYAIYPPINKAGYVYTKDLLQQWKQWSGKIKKPLLAVIKTKRQSTVTGLLPIKPIAGKGYEFYMITAELKSSSKNGHLSVGNYTQIEVVSDALPIDIRTLARSICTFNDPKQQCEARPIK